MNRFIYLELKKIRNKNNLAICVLFFIIILVPLFYYARVDVLDDKGNVHSGIGGWSILQERTAPVEGVMTTEYLFKMREHYQNSVDKAFIEGEVDTERNLGVKLEFPQNQLHWTVNFPYHRGRTTANNDFNLTDEQITNFYENWGNSFYDHLSDEINYFPYTKHQNELISEKMKSVQTPFTFKYNMGWQFLKIDLSWTLYIFFIFLSFVLSDSFSKDNIKGIDQIILSTKESRRKLINYKVRAACITSTFAYLVYAGMILIFIAIVYSFHGWDIPLQIGAKCFYSLNLLQEGIIYILMGYFAAIVITYCILFLSLLLKRGRVVLAISIIYFCNVETYKMGTGEIIEKVNIFMPQNFVEGLLDIENLFFVEDMILPYVVIALGLGLLYISFFKIAMKLLMKNYYLQ